MAKNNWLDKYKEGGRMQEYQPNFNDSSVSIPEGMVGMSNDTQGRNYSPAWGGQFKDGGNSSFKDDAESILALGSIAAPFPLNYGLSLAGSAIDLYDAYNAKTPHDRNMQLMEAALGAIPYGRMVKGMKIGKDTYKNYKALKPLAAINLAVDAKDTIDPNIKYAMGGSIPGSVGFTYARTIDPAPSEGKYAKKTLPSAEEGVAQPKEESSKDFLKGYINSPMYKQRLQMSGYPNPASEIKGRTTELDKTKIYYQDKAPNAEEIKQLTASKTPYSTIGSFYNRSNSKIIMDRQQAKDFNMDLPLVEAHERTHSLLNPRIVRGYEQDAMNTFDKKQLTNRLNPEILKHKDDKNLTQYNAHDLSPEENISDINGLRYQLYKKGVDIFNKDVTPEQLQELKENSQDFMTKRSFRNYDDKNLLWLLNNIAQAPQQAPDSNAMPTAQNGVEMKYYQEGLDWKPNNISRDGSSVKKLYPGGMLFVPPKLQEQVAKQTFGLLGDALSAPQKSATYAMTGKYQTPSEVMGIKNPYGAFASDAVLDPVNLIGAGLIKGASKLPSALNTAKKTIQNIGKTIKTVADPKYHTKAANQLAEGNQYLRDWYSHPAEVEKIKNSRMADEEAVANRFGVNTNDSRIRQDMIDNVDDQAAFFQKRVDEGNTDVQYDGSLLGNLWNKVRGKPSNITEGSAGTSWTNHSDYTSENFVRKYLSPRQRLNTIIHEGSHGADAGGSMFNDYDVDLLEGGFDTGLRGQDKYTDYLLEPTEIRARKQQMLLQEGATPDTKFSPEQINAMIEKGKAGGYKVDKKWFNAINNPANFGKMMNNMWGGIPAAVGVGVAAKQQQRDGGITNKGKELTKLDQLTNFTNYNTKQPGGWLNKYSS
jgi:hypothetical protein